MQPDPLNVQMQFYGSLSVAKLNGQQSASKYKILLTLLQIFEFDMCYALSHYDISIGIPHAIDFALDI